MTIISAFHVVYTFILFYYHLLGNTYTGLKTKSDVRGIYWEFFLLS